MNYDPIKPDYSDIERAIEIVNEARKSESERTGFPFVEVSGEEVQDAVKWADGQELQPIIDTRGFGIIINILNTYKDEFNRDCILTSPTNKDEVLQAHCLAHAGTQIVARLQNDIKARLAAAESTPDFIKQGIRLARGVPVSSTQ